MPTDIAASYDNLADHYHLIFEDWEKSVERQAAAIGKILVHNCHLPSAASILDCACGIGTQALGLAKAGFRVSACDLSPKAVQRAMLEASQRALDIQFFTANMLDLDCLGEQRFDAALCMDNSLPHLQSAEQVVQAAKQMKARLLTGGLLMISLRDYDHLIVERPVVQGPSFYLDQGRRRIVLQVWDWIDDRNYVFHLYITREIDTGWETFHTSAPYRAIRRNEVTSALTDAGFQNVRWLSPAESGFYQPIVIAVAG